MLLTIYKDIETHAWYLCHRYLKDGDKNCHYISSFSPYQLYNAKYTIIETPDRNWALYSPNGGPAGWAHRHQIIKVLTKIPKEYDFRNYDLDNIIEFEIEGKDLLKTLIKNRCN